MVKSMAARFEQKISFNKTELQNQLKKLNSNQIPPPPPRFLRASTSSNKSVFIIVAEPYRPVELIDIYIYYNSVYYFFILNSKLIFFKMLLTMVFLKPKVL
jgi:hypothetical protein